jgi:hypothetical protein
MVWTNLFKAKSFDKALKPRKKLFHIDPLIHGKGLQQVKQVFRMVDLPFVWSEKEILRENNPNSCYHKFPRHFERDENKKAERIAKLRAGLASAKEKELKYRQDRLNKRHLAGMFNLFKLTMPFMIKQQSTKLDADVPKKKTRKMLSDYVKEVPKNKTNITFGRRSQEKVKNLMVDGVIDVTGINEANKQRQRDQQKLRDKKIKEVENKKTQENIKSSPDQV